MVNPRDVLRGTRRIGDCHDDIPGPAPSRLVEEVSGLNRWLLDVCILLKPELVPVPVVRVYLEVAARYLHHQSSSLDPGHTEIADELLGRRGRQEDAVTLISHVHTE